MLPKADHTKRFTIRFILFSVKVLGTWKEWFFRIYLFIYVIYKKWERSQKKLVYGDYQAQIKPGPLQYTEVRIRLNITRSMENVFAILPWQKRILDLCAKYAHRISSSILASKCHRTLRWWFFLQNYSYIAYASLVSDMLYRVAPNSNQETTTLLHLLI